MNLAVMRRSVWNLRGKYIEDEIIVDTELHELILTNASGCLHSILGKVAQRSPNLQYLNVSSCSLSELRLNELCHVVSKPTLYQLDAANMRDIAVQDMEIILKAVNPECREINIGNCIFRDGNFSSFSLFSKFTSLEKLSLAYWEVTESDMMHVPPTLKLLDISGANLMTSFSFLLKQPVLVELDLDGVRLTEVAQDKLVDVLLQKRDMRIRINLERLPAERALSPERMSRIPRENNILFY